MTLARSFIAGLLISALTFFTSISALDGSSCLPIPHVTPQVTWETTQCAFCYPDVSKANDTLWMNYNGTLLNGTTFDSSYSAQKPWPAGDPFNFTLGAGQVIKGFDAGVYNMCAGERRHLVIPSEYGYGSKGVPGVIPPNATLIFDLELMGIGTIIN